MTESSAERRLIRSQATKKAPKSARERSSEIYALRSGGRKLQPNLLISPPFLGGFSVDKNGDRHLSESMASKMHSRSEADVSPALKRPLRNEGINTFYVEILAKDMRIETKVGGRRQSRFKEAFRLRRNQFIICRNLVESYDG